MPNNLIVDVGSIQDSVNKIEAIYNESINTKYNILGQSATPLHIDQSQQCMRIEAFAITSNQFSGWGKSTLTYEHNFTRSFAGGPVTTATIHSENLGVSSVNVVCYQERVKNAERVIIYVNRLDHQAWVKNRESFTIHVISIGY